MNKNLKRILILIGLIFAVGVTAAPDINLVPGLVIKSLLNCDTLNTTATGTVICGTDDGGSGTFTTTTINGLTTTTAYTFVGAGGLTISTTSPGTITFTAGAGGGGLTSTTLFTVGYLQFATTTNSITNSSIFQKDGKLGIGTTSPLSSLDISGDGTKLQGIAIRDSSSASGTWMYQSGPSFIINNDTANQDVDFKIVSQNENNPVFELVSNQLKVYNLNGGGSALVLNMDDLTGNYTISPPGKSGTWALLSDIYTNTTTTINSATGTIVLASSTGIQIIQAGKTFTFSNSAPNFNTTTTITAGAGLSVTNGGIGATTITNNVLNHWTLSGLTLVASSTSYDVGIGTASPTSRLHVVGSTTINQSDGTSAQDALELGNAGTGHALHITQTGNTSASNSVGGSLLITNTSNTGPGLVIYTNQAASAGNLVNFRIDNNSFAHDGVKIDYDGIGDGLAIAATASSSNALSLSNTGVDHTLNVTYTGTTADKGAMNLTSTNVAGSVFQISGSSTGLGIGKITHSGVGDGDSSILSLAGTNAGYLGQGIFLDMKFAGTQKLLNLRASTSEVLTLTTAGKLGLGSSTPSSTLTVIGSAQVSGLSGCDTIDTTAQGVLICGNDGGGSALNHWTLTGNNLVASSTGYNVGVGTTTPPNQFTVGTTTHNGYFGIQPSSTAGISSLFQIKGVHVVATGTVPTVSSCGTNPAIRGTDMAGVVTVGGVAATTCTVTFASQWTLAPACVISSNTAIAAETVTVTTSTMIFAGTAITSDIVNYICLGNEP